MRIRMTWAQLLAAAAASAWAGGAAAQIPIRAQRLVTGLSSPVFAAESPDGTGRLFVLEQKTGNVKIFNRSTGASVGTFLTVTGMDTAGSEQGLLGLAFHPDYATNGKFYVNFTATGGAYGAGVTNVREYTVSAGNPNLANAASARTILTFDQPQTNHNGGWIGFGPKDGLLYVATGDGGNGNDQGTGHTEPGGNAQDVTNNLLGKMLRVDVNGDDFAADANRNYAIPRGGAGKPVKNPFADPVGGPAVTGDDEIWAYGLRNPWRASFDRQTGDLYIGDVGQGLREEIDFQPANSAGGANYGWRLREGTQQTPTVGGAKPAGNVDPIFDYANPSPGAAAVVGGYAYRGTENVALQGAYFFADTYTGQFWQVRHDGTGLTRNRQTTAGAIPTDAGTISNIVSFGEDSDGNLYAVAIGGSVYRLIPAIPGDANQDLRVDSADLAALADNYRAAGTANWVHGDFNDDDAINAIDLALLARGWNTGVNSAQQVSFSEALSAYPGLAAEVPEPGAVAVAAALAAAGAVRRRRTS